MIRLDDRLAERVSLLLAYVVLARLDIHSIVPYVANHLRSDLVPTALLPGLVRIINEGSWKFDLDGEEAKVLTDLVCLDQLLSGDAGHEIIPVLDAVVDILNRPFTRNTLSAGALRSLRRALLLPEERAGLETRLAAKERFCANCQRPIVSGEAVTYAIDQNGNTVLNCCECVTPSRRICVHPGCEHATAMPPKVMKFFEKGWRCKEHEGEAVVKKQDRDNPWGTAIAPAPWEPTPTGRQVMQDRQRGLQVAPPTFTPGGFDGITFAPPRFTDADPAPRFATGIDDDPVPTPFRIEENPFLAGQNIQFINTGTGAVMGTITGIAADGNAPLPPYADDPVPADLARALGLTGAPPVGGTDEP